MASELRSALPPELAYLLPAVGSPWRWSSDGKWVEWSDGRTIVYRDQVMAVVERLAPRGLPPFGAILLLLAATRENWQTDGMMRTLLNSATHEELQTDANGPSVQVINSLLANRLRDEIKAAVDSLGAVSSLPVGLRASLIAQASLAEYVFDGGVADVDSTTAGLVVQLLKGRLDAETLSQHREGSQTRRLADELAALQPGLERVDAEPVANWLSTGVSGSVQPADIEIPLPVRVRSLIGTLRSDPELAGLANLATDLLATFHIPRALAAREDLPLGGVSDITNRGPLDRLLVSELANDDTTLAIRVAVGEAMYLRREAPAHHPKVTRHILLDSGIRLWGVPRIFATAVGLAMAATADKQGGVFTYRAAGHKCEDVDLSTREGIVRHLGTLEPHPDPILALGSLLARAAESSGEVSELFLVTSEPAFEELRTYLLSSDGAWLSAGIFIVTVSMSGRTVFWKLNAKGRQELMQTQLALEKLTPNDRPTLRPLLDRDAKLPDILRRESLPILLPAPVDPRRAAASPSLGLVAITHDGRLMLWTDRIHGGKQLTDRIPTGSVEGVFIETSPDRVVVVTYYKKQGRLTVLSSDLQNSCQRIVLTRNKPFSVASHQGKILVMYGADYRVIDPEIGDESVVRVPGGYEWQNGRFYRGGKGFWAAGVVGLDWVCSFDRFVLGIVDRPRGGPMVIYRDLSFQAADGERRFSVEIAEKENAGQTGFVQVTSRADSDRVIVRARRSPIVSKVPRGKSWVIDLNRRKADVFYSLDAAMKSVLGSAGSFAFDPAVNMRKNFDSIGLDGTGRLLLVTDKHVLTLMANSRSELIWAEMGLPKTVPVDRQLKFSPADSPAGTRIVLHHARWADGSEAWTDSRGMLHLRSSDSNLPQLTLTVSNEPAAGCTSEGTTFGRPYYFAADTTTDPEVVLELVRQFGARLKG